MSKSVDVADLEFLAQKSLFCLDGEKYRVRRTAYYAGLVCGLRIAREYTSSNVTSADPRFWTVLTGNVFPRPDVLEFVSLLKKYSYSEFVFEAIWIPEPRLRYGEPGVQYASGIEDAVLVGIKQVPLFYRIYNAENWQILSITWINVKIMWALRKLEFEKRV